MQTVAYTITDNAEKTTVEVHMTGLAGYPIRLIQEKARLARQLFGTPFRSTTVETFVKGEWGETQADNDGVFIHDWVQVTGFGRKWMSLKLSNDETVEVEGYGVSSILVRVVNKT